MARYRDGLPQTRGQACITDGGLETSLVFIDRVELPCFAAFPLVDSVTGRKRLGDYFRPYLELAAARGAGFVIDTPTWRANPDWGERLGYDAAALAEANRRSVAFTAELRDQVPAAGPVVINGVLGPRGDGYRVEDCMTPGGGPGLPRAADRGLRRNPRRHGRGRDHDLRRRGHRDRPRRGRSGPALRRVLHGGDRRAAAVGTGAARRRSSRSTRRRAARRPTT